MKTSIAAVASVLAIFLAAAFAAETPPATQPATQPSAAEISALIARLGDEDFRQRELAAGRLRQIGRPALPALREAAQHPDPEIQTRASELIKDIDGTRLRQQKDAAVAAQRAMPRAMVGGNVVQLHVAAQAGANVRVQTQVVNGHRTAQAVAEEPGRTVRIEETSDGVTVTVTTKNDDGTEVSRQYQAADVEELKKKHPEAHALYEKYLGRNAANVRIQMHINGAELTD